MNEENFKRQLNIIVEELKRARSDSEAERSYTYLLEKLSDLTINNIKDRKGIILHFLADSYNGSKEIAARIADFISLYSTR